jgi:S1-C subfamily serine protease
VRESGAALAAGLKKGDIITKVNGVPVLNAADMVGQIATFRPGEKINITYRRDGKEITTPVTLKNISGTTEIVKTSAIDKLGASFKEVSKEAAKALGINGGVVIAEIRGGIMSKVRVQEGYIILKANGKEVKTVAEFAKVIDSASGSVKLEGMYEGYEGIHTVVINL